MLVLHHPDRGYRREERSGSVIPTFAPVTASGTFDNSGLGGKEISNLKFCAPSGSACDTPTLDDDDVDTDNRTVSNTISDQEGVATFTFDVLDNFTVDESMVPAGYSRGGPKNRTWTWMGDVPPPRSVPFRLQAGESGSATYFLEATDDCIGPKTTDFDPTFNLGPAAPTVRLSSPYPNPFHDRTTIELTLPERSDVRLTVYDVMGRQVATLADGAMGAGSHQVKWCGDGNRGQRLASGVYLIRLHTDSQARSRRVTLLR